MRPKKRKPALSTPEGAKVGGEQSRMKKKKRGTLQKSRRETMGEAVIRKRRFYVGERAHREGESSLQNRGE